jgi:hypothetical protein
MKDQNTATLYVRLSDESKTVLDQVSKNLSVIAKNQEVIMKLHRSNLEILGDVLKGSFRGV